MSECVNCDELKSMVCKIRVVFDFVFVYEYGQVLILCRRVVYKLLVCIDNLLTYTYKYTEMGLCW